MSAHHRSFQRFRIVVIAFAGVAAFAARPTPLGATPQNVVADWNLIGVGTAVAAGQSPWHRRDRWRFSRWRSTTR